MHPRKAGATKGVAECVVRTQPHLMSLRRWVDVPRCGYVVACRMDPVHGSVHRPRLSHNLITITSTELIDMVYSDS